MSWEAINDPYKILAARLAALTPAPSIAWDNVGFTPTAGTDYLRVDYLPATVIGKRLGTKEETLGVFQVTVCATKGTGAAPALVETVKAWFPAGLTLRKTAGGGYVRIRRTQPGPRLLDGDRVLFPLSITFEAIEES